MLDELELLEFASLGEKSGDKDKRRVESLAVAQLMGVKDVFFLNLSGTMIMHDGVTVGLLDDYMGKLNLRRGLTYREVHT